MNVFTAPSPAMFVIGWVGHAASRFVDLYTAYVVPVALDQDSSALLPDGHIAVMCRRLNSAGVRHHGGNLTHCQGMIIHPHIIKQSGIWFPCTAQRKRYG